MEITTPEKLLHDQLKDLYSAESQLLKALPKMAKTASSRSLADALSKHLDETEGQVDRLDQIGEALDLKLTGKKCKAMEGLLEEGKEVLESEGDENLIDLAMIAAGQRVEHYEISSYGSARALAEQLGLTDVARLLQETLNEESAADEKLTQIAEGELYQRMPRGEDSADGDEENHRGGKRKASRASAGRSRR
jgi:ferritin-like metal-binding protein YciE